MAASIIARVDCRDNTKEAWWHACPEDVDAYRIVLLEEENRLRPWMEILFCQLRAEEESDEMLASRLSRFVALWAEQDGATDRGSRFSSRTLRTALRGLSPRSRTILLLHYRGMTQRAIAQRYGLSCQRVSQIIQTALRQAKKIIVQENNI